MSDIDPDHQRIWPRPHPPLSDAVGREAREIAQIYRDDGFFVELVDADGFVTDDLWISRIRLFVRDDRVERAVQG